MYLCNTYRKNKYEEELARIEKYTKEEYTDLVNSGVDVPEYDEPSFMVKAFQKWLNTQ